MFQCEPEAGNILCLMFHHFLFFTSKFLFLNVKYKIKVALDYYTVLTFKMIVYILDIWWLFNRYFDQRKWRVIVFKLYLFLFFALKIIFDIYSLIFTIKSSLLYFKSSKKKWTCIQKYFKYSFWIKFTSNFCKVVSQK